MLFPLVRVLTMSNLLAAMSEKQAAAALLSGALGESLTLESVWPEAFSKGGPVGLKMVGRMLPHPSRRTAPYMAHLTGPAGVYVLTRAEMLKLKPALTLHPDFKD